MKKVLVILCMFSMVTACANPDVVDERKIGDANLTCSEIKNEIEEADKFEAEAREEKGVTGKNVAAALLFWPALLVSYSNVEEAIDAARDRKEHLLKLADKKSCKM